MTTPDTDAELSGRRKAAVLLVSLGSDLSSQVFRFLSEAEIETLTLEIASLRSIPSEVRSRVLSEFQDIGTAKDYIRKGGLEYARDILERSLGEAKAKDVIERLTQSLQVRPFDFLRRAQPSQIAGFLRGEHPQTIALILAYLDPQQAVGVLTGLSEEIRIDVARRIALLDRTSPEVVRDVEQILERRFAGLVSTEVTKAGGVAAVVEILNRADRSTEKSIVNHITEVDPDLAEQIKRQLFLFEDIVHLDDRSLQRVLQDVEMNRDMPLALKVSSDEVKSRIFANVSQRAAETLKEAIEYLGPVRVKDVEEAQQRIVAVVRRLEEEGHIVIGHAGGDELIV